MSIHNCQASIVRVVFMLCVMLPSISTHPHAGVETLVSGSVDSKVKAWSWDTDSDSLVAKWTADGHQLGVVSVAIDPSGEGEVIPCVNCIIVKRQVMILLLLLAHVLLTIFVIPTSPHLVSTFKALSSQPLPPSEWYSPPL